MKHLRELGFMFLLTTVCTIVLVLAENVYQQRMASDPRLMRRIMALTGTSGVPDPDIPTRFPHLFASVRHPAIRGVVYRSLAQTGVLVREEEGAGLWGTIGLLVAYDTAGDRVLGLDVLSHSETPGLGARIEEPTFLARFRNLTVGRGVRAAKTSFRAGEFDAVSGATLTSKAVEEIVNRAVIGMRQVAASVQEQQP